jgi:hypothetical protein
MNEETIFLYHLLLTIMVKLEITSQEELILLKDRLELTQIQEAGDSLSVGQLGLAIQMVQLSHDHYS